MENNFVSIIMPAYNCELFIKDAIESVINQKYQNWELIIIDDCSTDNTFNISRKYSVEYPNIILKKNKVNSGVAHSRNVGIECSKGEWIAFLDSDDIWDINKLNKQVKYINNKSAEFIFTGSKFITNTGQPLDFIFEVPNLVSYEKLRTHNVISCSSVLIKKNHLEMFKMERDDLHEDYAVWLRVLNSGISAHGINEPLLTYRISADSKSGNKIKSILMTYKVFRFIDIGILRALFYTLLHSLNSVRKYKKIWKHR